MLSTAESRQHTLGISATRLKIIFQCRGLINQAPTKNMRKEFQETVEVLAKVPQICHPERSEGSIFLYLDNKQEILHFVQNDIV